MVVVLSKFRVRNGMEDAVRLAFRARPHLVDDAPGFPRMEVLVGGLALNQIDDLWRSVAADLGTADARKALREVQ